MPTPAPAAQTNDVRLTELQTKVLHALLKPVGDFTSQKQLEIRLAHPETGEPPDQLPEAIFALYDQKPPLMFESLDLKRHYALTDAGRRLQRKLAPVKPKPAQEDEDDAAGTDAAGTDDAPKARTPQKRSKGSTKPTSRPNQKPARALTALNAPTAQTEHNDAGGKS